jgi:hypothetical protein
MSHPDTQRPFGTRPIVADLTRQIAERHDVSVHSMLTGRRMRPQYARANLCYMLVDRGWRLDAIDSWFGFKQGEASESRTRWKRKLADDMARRIDAALEREGRPPTEEEIAEEKRLHNAERRAKYRAHVEERGYGRPPKKPGCTAPKGASPVKLCGRVVVDEARQLCRWHYAMAEAPASRSDRHHKPLTATVLETSLMAHGIAAVRKKDARADRPAGQENELEAIAKVAP